MLSIETKIARNLRRKSTPWENKLWAVLKNRNLFKLKFRRQHKIGKYIVDLCCPEEMLVIELDGGQHNFDENITKDSERQKFLEKHGYKVLRFWNNEIDENLDGVIQKIIIESQK